jgi:hypothetical protein
VSILLGVSGGVAFYVCWLKDKIKTGGHPRLAACTVFAALYAAVGASLYSVSGNHWMALFWPAQFMFSGVCMGAGCRSYRLWSGGILRLLAQIGKPGPRAAVAGMGCGGSVDPPDMAARSVSPCPSCGASAGKAQHKSCRIGGQADLYIDIATGHKHCIACGRELGLESWTNHCTRCGAVWEGGEIWQGMAAEVGSMGDLAWLKAAGVRRGTPEITFLGWSSCLGCQRRFERKAGLLLGIGNGGICTDCHDTAKKRHAARFRFRAVPDFCNWCGYGASARTRRVRVGKAHICRSCTEEISQMRSVAGRAGM